ncbi:MULTISPECIES: ABC transporter permease DevC [Leptolyngbya]|jgi:putative ABC transport system permease protein|uniref:DevC protein n=2 Tax=Leptolyngbya boryana TaxID=1184 RepID=A0A1Z4JIM4_LEPBY|nr:MULTISPECIES: ABC transporter permease DevC [Leptolyngbya]BAY56566.1 DevC protein [Leptolyngbya boryana NIES-2135]MBD1857746.1 FtsX-like permease family protein [Leptolyngbya sp. FACHB-1624]MBD2369871.1 FtsX-like permease family protein [Leptolyngbya sp. FACHB-161]MBD2376184.1 FtsX-like permease family protein [Leptolyngbya sp. FACHB-238]MBD2400459.1 FtsX-like permease family protein [Leptolyngbya sp. FACHB-239]
MARKTPLAWFQLMKEKARLVVAIAGIGFADMLMFMQLGFQDSLYDSATVPHRMLQADLVIIDPRFKSLAAFTPFSRERLYQTKSSDRVQSVSSIRIAMGQWKNPETRLTRSILIWGIEPDAPSFKLSGLQENLEPLKLLNNVVFDRVGRPEFGAIADTFQKQGSVSTELNQQLINVSGLVTMGASFTADGNVFMSDSTFLRLYRDRQASDIDIGLIQLKPNSDVKAVQAQLSASLPDVKVLTPEEFAGIERNYWESQGTIGFIFGIGVIVGFIVGTVIVYQILYTDVANHLPEYATLKAMGYSDRFLLNILLQEALILAVLGFIPGFAVAVGLYQITYAATLLPIAMTANRAITVFVLTVVMCSISGAIAMRKLQAADPADIF